MGGLLQHLSTSGYMTKSRVVVPCLLALALSVGAQDESVELDIALATVNAQNALTTQQSSVKYDILNSLDADLADDPTNTVSASDYTVLTIHADRCRQVHSEEHKTGHDVALPPIQSAQECKDVIQAINTAKGQTGVSPGPCMCSAGFESLSIRPSGCWAAHYNDEVGYYCTFFNNATDPEETTWGVNQVSIAVFCRSGSGSGSGGSLPQFIGPAPTPSAQTFADRFSKTPGSGAVVDDPTAPTSTSASAGSSSSGSGTLDGPMVSGSGTSSSGSGTLDGPMVGGSGTSSSGSGGTMVSPLTGLSGLSA